MAEPLSWRLSAVAVLLAAAPACGGAQAGPGTNPPAPSGGSGLASGVYTADQAAIGGQTFAVTCTACHGDFDLLSRSFPQKWTGRTLQELYSFIRTRMPESDPGSLDAATTVQLIAYLLSRQGFPAGETPLPPNDSVLAGIVFEPAPSP